MSEIDYGAVFGIDTAEAEMAEADMQGEKETEIAEPDNAADGGTEAEASEEKPAEAPRQSAEENAGFAAARRRAEKEAEEKINRAKKEAEDYVSEVFKVTGILDPYTQKPITSKEEFEAYRENLSKEKKESFKKMSGVSDEEYREFIEDLPEVREARRKAEEAEKISREAREREAEAKISAQVREIGELDPSVRSLSDITENEKYPEIYALVKRGYTLTDAYKIAHFDTLSRGAEARARQQALNAERSKHHLEKTGTGRVGAEEVPADIAAEYRTFNPGATDAEIRKHYAAYRKK